MYLIGYSTLTRYACCAIFYTHDHFNFFFFARYFVLHDKEYILLTGKKTNIQFLGVSSVHGNSGQHLTWTTYPVMHLKFFGCWWPFTRMVPSHPTGSFLPAMISSNLKENIVAMFSLKSKTDISVPCLLKTTQHIQFIVKNMQYQNW